jgi:hypothetical protein
MRVLIKKVLLLLAMLSGLGLFLYSILVSLKYNLPWVVDKFGHEKGAPWESIFIGLALAGWALVELLITNKSNGADSKEKE